jgi:osmotically-inducible protein OsmY
MMTTVPEESHRTEAKTTPMNSGTEELFQPAEWRREFDERLRENALSFLKSSGYRSLWELQCEVLDGIVTLSGMVSSFYLKQVAQALVLRMDAVKGIQNRIWVCED